MEGDLIFGTAGQTRLHPLLPPLILWCWFRLGTQAPRMLLQALTTVHAKQGNVQKERLKVPKHEGSYTIALLTELN